ncbi:hypothetical protein GCM10009716_00140 [Streptomyces sodiiphilus]|uniref:Uncharacterized protein n=1 Tax=Streptomyces sodiiphilus TaxID=226217 RepID=A0ABN2NQ26_9ACTN
MVPLLWVTHELYLSDSPTQSALARHWPEPVHSAHPPVLPALVVHSSAWAETSAEVPRQSPEEAG